MQLLLDKGAAVDAVLKDSHTALIIAAQQGHEAVVKLLLDKGAAVDAVLWDGHTALIIAAQQGHEAVAKLLLDKGAAVDVVSKLLGDTALILAAQNGHEAVAALLLDKGAVVDAATKDSAAAARLEDLNDGCPGGGRVDSADVGRAGGPRGGAARQGRGGRQGTQGRPYRADRRRAEGHAAVAKVLDDKGAALRTSAVKQRLCGVECGDGRVAQSMRIAARRPACSSAGVMLSCCCSCCIVLQVFLSGVAHAITGGAATRWGRRVSDVDFRAGRFASAARAFFLRVVTLVTTFSGLSSNYITRRLWILIVKRTSKITRKTNLRASSRFRRYVVQAGRGVLRL